jgi:hypothetical protein
MLFFLMAEESSVGIERVGILRLGIAIFLRVMAILALL